MNQDIQKLRNEVEAKERAFSETKKRLDDIVKSCQHKFGETIPDHTYREAYRIEGDKPGTMGSDWRGPLDVPAETELRWKRICDYCGKVEYTTQTKQKIEHLPDWNDDKPKAYARRETFDSPQYYEDGGWLLRRLNR